MKYSEFREYLNLKKIPMEEDEERLIVFYHIEISKTEEHRVEFLITIVENLYECEMLKKAFELAETPLDERGL